MSTPIAAANPAPAAERLTKESFGKMLDAAGGTMTPELFVKVVTQWSQDNQKKISLAWVNHGEGWEDWMRVELGLYLHELSDKVDVGDGRSRRTYGDNAESADLVLNDHSADPKDKIVVEFKAQSLGRAQLFTNDFQDDVNKLDRVQGEYGGAQRMALGFFYTMDVTSANNAKEPTKGEKSKSYSQVAANNFVRKIESYDRVLIPAGDGEPVHKTPASEAEKMTKTKRILTPLDTEKKKMPIFDLGFVYTVLPPKNAAKASKEEEVDAGNDNNARPRSDKPAVRSSMKSASGKDATGPHDDATPTRPRPNRSHPKPDHAPIPSMEPPSDDEAEGDDKTPVKRRPVRKPAATPATHSSGDQPGASPFRRSPRTRKPPRKKD